MKQRGNTIKVLGKDNALWVDYQRLMAAIQRVRQLGDEECECLNYEACCEHEGIQRAIKALDGETNDTN